jgi:hypothetical protein
MVCSGVVSVGWLYLLPVVDGLDVFVFGRFEARGHVALTKLFSLVHIESSGQSRVHEAQELCAELAIFILVAAEAGDRARVVCGSMVSMWIAVREYWVSYRDSQ